MDRVKGYDIKQSRTGPECRRMLELRCKNRRIAIDLNPSHVALGCALA